MSACLPLQVTRRAEILRTSGVSMTLLSSRAICFWFFALPSASYADAGTLGYGKYFTLNAFGRVLDVPCGFNVIYRDEGVVRLDNLSADKKEHEFPAPTIMRLGSRDQYFEDLLKREGVKNHPSKCKSTSYLKLENLNGKGYTIAAIYDDANYLSIASDSPVLAEKMLHCD